MQAPKNWTIFRSLQTKDAISGKSVLRRNSQVSISLVLWHADLLLRPDIRLTLISNQNTMWIQASQACPHCLCELVLLTIWALQSRTSRQSWDCWQLQSTPLVLQRIVWFGEALSITCSSWGLPPPEGYLLVATDCAHHGRLCRHTPSPHQLWLWTPAHLPSFRSRPLWLEHWQCAQGSWPQAYCDLIASESHWLWYSVMSLKIFTQACKLFDLRHSAIRCFNKAICPAVRPMA